MKTKILLAILAGFAFQTVQAAQPAKRIRTEFDSEYRVETKVRYQPGDERFLKLKLSPGSLGRPGVRGEVSTRIGHTGFAVGALGEYMNFTEGSTSFNAAGGGVNASYYFKGSPFVDSWYVTPAFVYRSGHIELTSINTYSYSLWAGTASGSANFDIYSLETLLGYQWHWQAFNLSLGAGPAFHYLTVKDIRGSFRGGILGSSDFSYNQPTSSSVTGAVVEAALGWTF